MSTWARTATGDIVIPVTGQGASAIITDPDQCAAIRINDGLQMWLGNWKPDTSQGMPWQSVIGQKSPSLVGTGNLMRKTILLLGAPVVIAVTQLSLVFKRSLRDLGYTFSAQSRTGATIVGGSNGPANRPFVVVQ